MLAIPPQRGAVYSSPIRPRYSYSPAKERNAIDARARLQFIECKIEPKLGNASSGVNPDGCWVGKLMSGLAEAAIRPAAMPSK